MQAHRPLERPRLYFTQGDYATALARSQEAEKLFRKLNIEAHVSRALHLQGLILNRLARAAQTNEERTAHLAAAERFQQSLDIARRIGDEAGALEALCRNVDLAVLKLGVRGSRIAFQDQRLAVRACYEARNYVGRTSAVWRKSVVHVFSTE